MIKINDRFEIRPDKYCWQLVEYVEATSKKNGSVYLREEVSYPGTLLQACMSVINNGVKSVEKANDIVAAILACKEEIIWAIDAINERVERAGT